MIGCSLWTGWVVWDVTNMVHATKNETVVHRCEKVDLVAIHKEEVPLISLGTAIAMRALQRPGSHYPLRSQTRYRSLFRSMRAVTETQMKTEVNVPDILHGMDARMNILPLNRKVTIVQKVDIMCKNVPPFRNFGHFHRYKFGFAEQNDLITIQNCSHIVLLLSSIQPEQRHHQDNFCCYWYCY